jgi:hypothetical protein
MLMIVRPMRSWWYSMPRSAHAEVSFSYVIGISTVAPWTARSARWVWIVPA